MSIPTKKKLLTIKVTAKMAVLTKICGKGNINGKIYLILSGKSVMLKWAHVNNLASYKNTSYRVAEFITGFLEDTVKS